jgi:DNA-binding GntR family transcriptional regulator
LTTALNESISAMRRAQTESNLAAYYSENLHFHWLIVVAACNEQLSRTYQEVVQKLHLARLQSLSHNLGMHTSITEHQGISQAIAQGDAPLSQTLMSEHVTRAFDRLGQSREDSPPISTTPEETT